MEKKDISYKLQITEEEKIVAEQLVTRADYLPRVGETITVLPYEGPLDDFVEKIRIKEEVDKHIPWIKGSYALLRFQQEFAGDYQVMKVRYGHNLLAVGTIFCYGLNDLGRSPIQSPYSDFDPRERVETYDYAIKLHQVGIPLVVVTKLDSKAK